MYCVHCQKKLTYLDNGVLCRACTTTADRKNGHVSVDFCNACGNDEPIRGTVFCKTHQRKLVTSRS